MTRDRFGHAVVLGASMAGLLAARVLSDHFDDVTLIERDTLPRQPEARKGVPQGRHVHVLLARGHSVLERLFPAITDGLREAGGLAINGGREIAWHHAGGWRTLYDSDFRLLALSRPLLETRVAERVRALPNVRILEGLRVQGIKSERGAVTGVSVAGGQQNVTMGADLVVDATGRGSAMPRWLEELGCAPLVTDRIPVPLTYSTCLFRRRDSGPDWRALLVTDPGGKRAAFAWAIEDSRWLVTLASLFDEPSPRDREAFLSFAKSLPVPELYDVIRDLDPQSAFVRYHFPGSQRRRYERVRSLPAGLIAIGDSVCSFNPVYGQGITVGALEAEALAHALPEARRSGGLDKEFAHCWFREIGRIIDVAWQGVSIEDFRFPELADQRPVTLRLLQWYMDRVHRATHSSSVVTDQFYRVIGFLDPPTALFRPRVIADILLAARSE